MNKPNEVPTHWRDTQEKEAIAAALDSLQPQTPLGARLIELSRRGLEQGVNPLSADEVLEYLGREPYEDVH